ncbi:MAG TPA: hypothetical protein VEX18_10800 [Polyangiaceae bacterium]|nr:hypothetical protein [Polyangiaceae bacterium]
MRTWPTASLLLILSLGLGCGGPAEPAASPEPAAAAGESAPPAAEPVEAGDGEKSAVSAGSASDDDVNAILQLVVDDPELDKHLNLGQPGRFPLQISGENLPGSLKVVKATEPVKVVGPPKSKNDAVLVLTEIDIKGDKATVRYRYDVEGIRATVTLSKSSHGWELKNSRLVEH